VLEGEKKTEKGRSLSNRSDKLKGVVQQRQVKDVFVRLQVRSISVRVSGEEKKWGKPV